MEEQELAINWAFVDEYFSYRRDWFNDSRDSEGNRIPSLSKQIRQVKTLEELEMWLTVLDDSKQWELSRR